MHAIPPLVMYVPFNLTNPLYQREMYTMHALSPESGWMNGKNSMNSLSTTFLSMLHLADLYYYY